VASLGDHAYDHVADTSGWPSSAVLAYRLAIQQGATPAQAKDFAAVQFGESGFDPNARNKSSGAAGLYQLLSQGYVDRANALGGVYNPRANIMAILPDYMSYYRAHPTLVPGAAGAAVERSGQGAQYYAQGYQHLPGMPGAGQPPVVPGTPGTPGVPGSAPMVIPGATIPGIPGQRTLNTAALSRRILGSFAQSGNVNLMNLPQWTQSAYTTTPAIPPIRLPSVELAGTPGTPGAAGTPGQIPTASDFSKTWLSPGFSVRGLPYQGTHAKAFNVRGGSDNWQSENAIDIYMPKGTPIYAPVSGTLGNTGSLGQGGRFAGLRTNLYGNGQGFYFAHMSKLAPGIKAGAKVKKGQLLGYSGEANGVQHLHFAVENGTPLSYYGGK